MSNNEPEAETVVDAHGNLHVPDAYRTTYQALGSCAVAADRGKDSKELHVIYASPGTITAYRENGRFPDRAVLVKEVFHAATGKMKTGTVSHAEMLKGWFVMVKDSKGRYAGNKLWGDGWGWSWFDAANPSKTTSTDYKTDCQPCHVPARASDWIYVSGYPPLRRYRAGQRRLSLRAVHPIASNSEKTKSGSNTWRNGVFPGPKGWSLASGPAAQDSDRASRLCRESGTGARADGYIRRTRGWAT